MAIVCRYFGISGAGRSACVFLGERWDDRYGIRPGESESWVLVQHRVGPKLRVNGPFGTTDWLTRIWRAPSGTTYVTNTSANAVVVHPNPARSRSVDEWKRQALRFQPVGVFGLDDRRVYLWGSVLARKRSVPRMARRHGRGWAQMPAPTFQVRALHGIASATRPPTMAPC